MEAPHAPSRPEADASIGLDPEAAARGSSSGVAGETILQRGRRVRRLYDAETEHLHLG